MQSASVIPASTDVVEKYRSQIEAGHPALRRSLRLLQPHGTVLLRRDRGRFFASCRSNRRSASSFSRDSTQLRNRKAIVLIVDALTAKERVSRRTDAFSDALCFLPSIWRIVGKNNPSSSARPPGMGLRFIVLYRYRLFGRYEQFAQSQSGTAGPGSSVFPPMSTFISLWFSAC